MLRGTATGEGDSPVGRDSASRPPSCSPPPRWFLTRRRSGAMGKRFALDDGAPFARRRPGGGDVGSCTARCSRGSCVPARRCGSAAAAGSSRSLRLTAAAPVVPWSVEFVRPVGRLERMFGQVTSEHVALARASSCDLIAGEFPRGVRKAALVPVELLRDGASGATRNPGMDQGKAYGVPADDRERSELRPALRDVDAPEQGAHATASGRCASRG